MRAPACYGPFVKIIVSLLSLILAGALLMTVPGIATERRTLDINDSWGYEAQYLFIDSNTERSAYFGSFYDHSYENSLNLRVYKCISESSTYDGPMQFSLGFTLNSGNVLYYWLHFSSSGGGSIDASVTQNGSRQPIELNDLLYFARSSDNTNTLFLRHFEKQNVYPSQVNIIGSFDGIGDLPSEYYSAFRWYCHAEVFAAISAISYSSFQSFYFSEPAEDSDTGFQMNAVHPQSLSDWSSNLFTLDPEDFESWKDCCWIIDFEFNFADGYVWKLSSPDLQGLLNTNNIAYYVTNCYLSYDYDPDVITHDQMQQIIDAINAPLDPGTQQVSEGFNGSLDEFNDVHDAENISLEQAMSYIPDDGDLDTIGDFVHSKLFDYGSGFRVWTVVYNEIWDSNPWIQFVFQAALTTSVFLSILGFSSAIGRSIHRDRVIDNRETTHKQMTEKRISAEVERRTRIENHSDKSSMMSHYRGDGE